MVAPFPGKSGRNTREKRYGAFAATSVNGKRMIRVEKAPKKNVMANNSRFQSIYRIYRSKLFLKGFTRYASRPERTSCNGRQKMVGCKFLCLEINLSDFGTSYGVRAFKLIRNGSIESFWRNNAPK